MHRTEDEVCGGREKTEKPRGEKLINAIHVKAEIKQLKINPLRLIEMSSEYDFYGNKSLASSHPEW